MLPGLKIKKYLKNHVSASYINLNSKLQKYWTKKMHLGEMKLGILKHRGTKTGLSRGIPDYNHSNMADILNNA